VRRHFPLQHAFEQGRIVLCNGHDVLGGAGLGACERGEGIAGAPSPSGQRCHLGVLAQVCPLPFLGLLAQLLVGQELER
jgi:hypothetical protein